MQRSKILAAGMKAQLVEAMTRIFFSFIKIEKNNKLKFIYAVCRKLDLNTYFVSNDF